MLSLPPQKVTAATAGANFNQALRSLMGRLGAPASEVDADIASFLQLRNSALSAISGGPTDVGVQAFMRYNYHMRDLVPRFEGFRSDVVLNVVWAEALSPTMREIKTNSLFFDWASVMWSFGAIESMRGARIVRDSDEGIRNACKCFQGAAGIFEFIRMHILPNFREEAALSTTISQAGLQFARDLMLAQGQLCFYEKALRDRKAGSMKPAIIAKLASQTSAYYDGVCRFCADVSLSRVLDPSWKTHAEFQARCMEGVAEYWMSVSVKEDAATKAVGYGEEIARLVRAERIVSKSIAFAQSSRLAPEVYNGTESLLRTIVSAKTSAEKDNRILYLEPIPSDSSLTAIENIAMVKASSLPEYYCTEKFLFPSLFPIEIKAAVELYSKEASKIHEDYKIKTDESSAQARATLGSLGLPAKLEAFKADGGLPDSLWARIVHLQGIGRPGSSCPPKDTVLAMFDDLVRAAEVSAEKFTHCENSLAREEANDERFRSRQPTWKGQPTSMLNRDIKIHLARLKEAYQSARFRDEELSAAITDTFKDPRQGEAAAVVGFYALMLPRKKIEDTFLKSLPGSFDLLSLDSTGSSVDGSQNSAASILERQLIELASLLEERQRNTVALFDVSMKGNAVVPELLQHQQQISASDKAMQLLTAATKPICEQIDGSLQRQAEMLAAISVSNAHFLEVSENDPLVLHRGEVLSTLDKLINSYFGIHSQLTAGHGFYNTLNSQLSTLTLTNDDLCYTQQLQRQEFEASLVQSMNDTQLEDDRKYAEALQAGTQYPLQSAVGKVVDGPPSRNRTVHQAYPPPSPQLLAQQIPQTQQFPQGVVPQTQGYYTMSGNPSVPSLPQQCDQQRYPPSVAYPQPNGLQPSYAPLPMAPQRPQQPWGPPSAPSSQQVPSFPQQQGYAIPQQPAPHFSSDAMKIERLVDMGFPRQKVEQALIANSGNEEAALNSLLSS